MAASETLFHTRGAGTGIPARRSRKTGGAVNWGRYAGLISYDDGKATIYLEETGKK